MRSGWDIYKQIYKHICKQKTKIFQLNFRMGKLVYKSRHYTQNKIDLVLEAGGGDGLQPCIKQWPQRVPLATPKLFYSDYRPQGVLILIIQTIQFLLVFYECSNSQMSQSEIVNFSILLELSGQVTMPAHRTFPTCQQSSRLVQQQQYSRCGCACVRAVKVLVRTRTTSHTDGWNEVTVPTARHHTQRSLNCITFSVELRVFFSEMKGNH